MGLYLPSKILWGSGSLEVWQHNPCQSAIARRRVTSKLANSLKQVFSPNFSVVLREEDPSVDLVVLVQGLL